MSYPEELELLETTTGFGDEVLCGHPPVKPGELSLAWISAKDVPAETTALTLTLAGDPGELHFPGVRPGAPAQRRPGDVPGLFRERPDRARHPLSLPGLPGPVPDRVVSRRGGLCAEPEPDDRRERHPLLPRRHHETGP
ncbi:MAG: hypothetical protein ACLU9S_12095 [Oscillospiraceae bacterium]